MYKINNSVSCLLNLFNSENEELYTLRRDLSISLGKPQQNYFPKDLFIFGMFFSKIVARPLPPFSGRATKKELFLRLPLLTLFFLGCL